MKLWSLLLCVFFMSTAVLAQVPTEQQVVFVVYEPVYIGAGGCVNLLGGTMVSLYSHLGSGGGSSSGGNWGNSGWGNSRGGSGGNWGNGWGGTNGGWNF